MNRVVFASLTLLFLLSVSSVTGLIRVVKADGGTIYINADGSISPSTAPIYTADNITYTLTDNITAVINGIVIERDNVVLNGAGYTVTGSENGFGTTLSNRGNVTVRNMTITNFLYGISLVSSSNNALSGNNVTANNVEGIVLEYSSDNNVLSENTVTANGGDGIELDIYSHNNVLFGNNFANNNGGILLDSSNNTLSGNNVTANMWYGIYLASSSGNTLSGNNVTANKGYGIWLDSSSINSISGNNITANNQEGIWLGYASGNSIFGNSITENNDDGISLVSSSYSALYGNSVLANNGDGIVLETSDNNTLSGNNITANSNYGIWFNSSSNDTISGSDVAANSLGGIKLENCLDINIVNNDIADNDLAGIWLFFSNSSLVSQNRITRTHYAGIILDMSSSNTILENDVRDNRANMVFEYSVNGGVALSSNNRIFHNNFINGTWNAVTYFAGQPENFWDDGYPSGGNYWSDYNGTDVNNGSYQNETGSDGIGDTPYLIDASNMDYFPLMGMFSNFSTLTGYPVNIISNSTISGFAAPIWLEHPEITTLMFNVTGTNGSTGFCRVSFSTAMMNGTYHVSVDGTEVPYTLLPCSNASYSYIYFTYKHSTHEIQITIPEFSSFLILALLMATTLLAVIIYKKKGVKTSRS